MFNLKPTITAKNILDVTPEVIKSLNVKAIFIDVDDTLSEHGSQTPFDGTIEWTKKMCDEGYKLIIVSNNFKKRVEPFAALYGLPFVSFASKPLPWAFNKAKKSLKDNKLNSDDCLVIGDQIFTDVLGANFSRMKSILLEPIGNYSGLFIRFKRIIEKYLRNKI